MGSSCGDDRSLAKMAESEYVMAETSVWWDANNSEVPKICDANAIVQNVRSSLAKLNYRGSISIHAYGDANRIPSAVQHALFRRISLVHVPSGSSNNKILVDMLLWTMDNLAPANIVLISREDGAFSYALNQLNMMKYIILLLPALLHKASASIQSSGFDSGNISSQNFTQIMGPSKRQKMMITVEKSMGRRVLRSGTARDRCSVLY